MGILGTGRQYLQWFKVQARDTVELFVLPSLAIVFPWSWSFAVFRCVVKLPFLYRADATQALHNAQRFGWVDNPRQWLQRRKLVTLVDHADHYLARTRSRKWMARYLDVEGAWPSAMNPAMLCTFHWGAGMWSLRHARLANMRAHSLVAPMRSAHFQGRPVMYAYVKARVQTVSNELGVAALDVSKSMRQVLNALRSREQVLAAIDVPPDSVDASVEIDMLGVKMQVPRGLLRVAADNRIPVTLFTVSLDVMTGRRQLRLITLPVETNAENLTKMVFNHLNQLIQQESWAWHFWAQADRFLTHNNSSLNA